MSKYYRRLLCLLLALSVCLSFAVPAFAADADPAPEIAVGDGMAFDNTAEETFADGDNMEAWVNMAVAADTMKALLNKQTLYPQPTGWKELDTAIEDLLKTTGGTTTYEKVYNVYTYLVKEITYSWDGYSRTTAPAYEYFTNYNYLKTMTYNSDLRKSVPDDMANRTYHVITKKSGVCYDYAIAFSVICRYIGINAYVHTGYFVFEDSSLGAGHHGWSILELGGTKYLFDPQRDARNWQYNGNTGFYFGITRDAALNGVGYSAQYLPDYRAVDTANNTARDNSMIPVTADRYTENAVPVTVLTSGSGVADGADKYPRGTVAQLTAVPKEAGPAFQGWYTTNGELLSDSITYRFAVTEPTTVIAMFEGDYFCDIPANAWYRSYAISAAEHKVISGTAPFRFSADTTLTRAMVVQMLAGMSGANTTAAKSAPFADIASDAWYAKAVNWAYENKVVSGMDDTHFAPDSAVTREQFMVILVSYAEKFMNLKLSAKDCKFTDNDTIASYAVTPLKKAFASGFISGYPDGSVKPKNELTRAEGATIMASFISYLEGLEEPAA